MGLDNSVIVRTKQRIPLPPEVKCNTYIHRDNTYEYEFCYWRKCYNVRDEILSLFDDYDGDGGAISMNKDDLKEIWIVINRLNHKKNWNSDYSIWTYMQIRDSLDQQLLNIEWLLDNYDDSWEVEFIDSY